PYSTASVSAAAASIDHSVVTRLIDTSVMPSLKSAGVTCARTRNPPTTDGRSPPHAARPAYRVFRPPVSPYGILLKDGCKRPHSGRCLPLLAGVCGRRRCPRATFAALTVRRSNCAGGRDGAPPCGRSRLLPVRQPVPGFIWQALRPYS